MVNIMGTDDDLATQEAGASATMIFAQLNQDTPTLPHNTHTHSTLMG